MSESQQNQAPLEESPSQSAPVNQPPMEQHGPPMSKQEFDKILAQSENSPAIPPEEYESWPDWKRTGMLTMGLTFLEIVCIYLYNPDFLARLSAAFAGDFSRHFPGSAIFSSLLLIGTGILCGIGMLRGIKWVRNFAELRLPLGTGFVIVFLLLSELLISQQIWRLVPLVLLLVVLTITYISLARTRKPFYQAK